jgi:AcrR family transcriptional regulator
VATPSRGRTQGAQRTRESILQAALTIFAERGYRGAVVSDIVALAQTTKPMVYYHFGSKEGLFAAALEYVYAGMRSFEHSLGLEALEPEAAMRRLVEVSFDYHAAHPDWVRLISIANIHDAEHIAGSSTIASKNSTIVTITGALLARGAAAGVFRAGVDSLHLHLLIASMSFYRVSNRHTWRIIFQRDLTTPDEAAPQRLMLTEAVLAYLRPSAG